MPHARYRRRRSSWLEQDLRTRRQQLLRANWRELAKVAALFTVAALALCVGAREHPLQTGIVCAFTGAATVGGAGFLALADGSLRPPTETYGLDSKIRQARHGATTVQKLLRSHGVDTHERDGVLIVTFRDSDTWRPVMTSPTSPDPALPLHTAAQAAEHLLGFCARRDKHQRAVSARPQSRQ